MRARLRTLGRFEFLIGNAVLGPLPTQKSRALLVYLALNYRLETPRERLTELFWSEMEPARAREGLRTALSTIRRVFRDARADPSTAVLADRTFVRLNLTVDSDVESLEIYAKSEKECDWRSAIDLYEGDFLDGNYEEWVVARREHYATLFEDMLATLVQKTADVKAARLLLTRNPYDERAYATLLESDLQAQRMTAARELFARYRAAMSEAAIEPSRELIARFASLDEQPEDEFGLPFVARQTELAKIERGFAALSTHKSYVAMVVGEPGIGKTALIKRAEDLAARAQCHAFVVRAAEGSDIGAVWGPLYHRVTGTSPQKVAAMAADLPALMSSAIAGKLPQPGILFIDDAHALRGDALATLVELARLARNNAFGLVVAMRPEGLGGPALILAPYVDERMELGPLRREDVDAALTLALSNSTPQSAQPYLRGRAATRSFYYRCSSRWFATGHSTAIESDGASRASSERSSIFRKIFVGRSPLVCARLEMTLPSLHARSQSNLRRRPMIWQLRSATTSRLFSTRSIACSASR